MNKARLSGLAFFLLVNADTWLQFIDHNSAYRIFEDT